MMKYLAVLALIPLALANKAFEIKHVFHERGGLCSKLKKYFAFILDKQLQTYLISLARESIIQFLSLYDCVPIFPCRYSHL